jgi:D-alanine-D-alanine ligase
VPTIATVLAGDGLADDRLPSRPWVAKPRFGGSSIGVEVDVDDLSVVLALGRRGTGRAGMLVQPYLKGWEDLNIAVRTVAGGIELSPIERPLRSGDGVYTYEDKYLSGSGMDAAPRELPARVPGGVAGKIERAAQLMAAQLPLTGAPRLDLLWDGDQQVVLCEVNAIPGAWGNHLWKAGGVDRLQLYRDLVAEARRTGPTRPQWVATSDGRALRTSGTIASKLA